MLAKGDYPTVEQLREAARNSYPKRLRDKEISLKYADSDGDWLYISEDEDLKALNEHSEKLNGKKVKLVIDVAKSDKKQADNVEEVKQALEDVSLEEKNADQEMKEEINFEDLKDFKFADVAEHLEALFNSEDKFGPHKLFKALKDATEGTKAEHHVKRLMRKAMRGKFGPHRRHGRHEKHGSSSFEGRDSSSPENHCPPFFGPMAYGPCGPMMGPFAGPHMGGFGKKPHGPRHAKRFFRQFMRGFRSSSSEGLSSDERQQLRKERKQKCQQKREENKQKRQEHKKVRPVVTKQPEDVVIGKAGEIVNATIAVRNDSPWPLWLTWVKKIDGDKDVEFETIAYKDVRLFKEAEHEIQLAVKLPAEAGDYTATFGFFNKKGVQTGEQATIAFKAE
jgi:hypothetical protein